MSGSNNPLHNLSLCHSFVRPDDAQVLANTIIDDSEDLVGVYVNRPDDFILLTDVALHWVHGNKVRDIPFTEIAAVKMVNARDGELNLVLRDGGAIVVPVMNETENEPDTSVLRDFLVACIYWPHRSEHTERINEIQSRQDLYTFLDLQERDESAHHSYLRHALRRGYPEAWMLEQFNIDPAIAETPDVWRLVAILLCTESAEKDGKGVFGTRKAIGSIDDLGRVSDREETLKRALDLLSEDAKEALVLAGSESSHLGHDWIDSEFLMLGLIRQNVQESERILKRRNLDLTKLRELVESLVGRNVSIREDTQEFRLVGRAIEVLLVALLLVEKTNSGQIESKHLLQALASIQEGVHFRVLRHFRTSS